MGQDSLKGDLLSWLLEADAPGIRYLALRDLMECLPEDTELIAACRAAHRTGPIADILNAMAPAGYWVKPGAGYTQRYRSGVWSLIMLAQMGASIQEDERIGRACHYMLEHALSVGGQFSTNNTPSGTVDCLQGNLCWALTALGCEDTRLTTAFEWMARSVTGEGIAANPESEAPVHYFAWKCAPNFACNFNKKLPCGWGAVKVMLAFSVLPLEKRTPIIERAIEKGVDFLFSVDPATAAYPVKNGGKPSRDWWKFGFPVFYVTDLLQIVEALAALGYGKDPRLARAVDIIREKQGNDGRWLLEYNYQSKTWVDFGEKNQPNKWVTLRAYRVLKRIGA
jgi:hypothetical protein